jgi:rhodanese-related sulfurtransferase
MFVTYSPAVELAAFATLAGAVAWDWRTRRAPLARSRRQDAVAWIEPDELRRQRESGAAWTVLDVRGPNEFTGTLGHIPGALNISLGELDRRLGELRSETKGGITVVCRTDKRSAAAQATLHAAGFDDVTVLRGGMERWNALGFEAIRGDLA